MRLPKQLQLTVILVNVFGSRQHGFLRRRTLSIDCRLVNRALRSLDQGIRRERKQLLKTKRNRDREISDQFKEIPLAIGASKENEERGRRREIFSLLQQPLKQVLSASISLSLSLSLSRSSLIHRRVEPLAVERIAESRMPRQPRFLLCLRVFALFLNSLPEQILELKNKRGL